jgi:hypothetical protein
LDVAVGRGRHVPAALPGGRPLAQRRRRRGGPTRSGTGALTPADRNRRTGGTVPAEATPPARPGARTTGSTPRVLPVLDAPRLCGRFTRTEMNSGWLRAVSVDTAEGLPVRLVQR